LHAKVIICRDISKCIPGLIAAEKETFLRYWSNSQHWFKAEEPEPERRRLIREENDDEEDRDGFVRYELPVNGDNVEILEGRNVIYDLFYSPTTNNTPALRTVIVNGNLIIPMKKTKHNGSEEGGIIYIYQDEIDYDKPKTAYDKLASNNAEAEDFIGRIQAKHIFTRKGHVYVGLFPE